MYNNEKDVSCKRDSLNSNAWQGVYATSKVFSNAIYKSIHFVGCSVFQIPDILVR